MMPEDERTEEDKANELEARIKAPIVWSRLESGLRIEDLQERRYDEALALIKEHFLNDEVTYRSIGIRDDEEAVEEFLSYTRIQMKDKASLVAIEEDTGSVVGVMVLRVFDKVDYSRTFNLVKMWTTEKFSAIMKFYNQLESPVDIHKIFQSPRYLRIFTVAIDPEHRGRGLGVEMHKAAIKSALASNIEIVAGIYVSQRDQEMALNLGLQRLNDLYYVRYFVDDKIVFEDPGSGNYGASLMAMKIDIDNFFKR